MDGCPPLPDLREADLTGAVRRALGSESAVPMNWQVHPLGGGRGEITGGVYRVAGGGHDQGHQVSWSLVLKVVPEPDEGDDPGAHNYWKREFHIYQAGLLADLPGITAPRCWGADDRPGEGTWLWLEDISGLRRTAWRDQDDAQAARNLGQFGAAYLRDRPLPRGAWLSDRMLRKESAFFGPYLRGLPATLDHPLVRQFCPAGQAARLERLWTAREALLRKVEGLPRTFCHLDAFARAVGAVVQQFTPLLPQLLDYADEAQAAIDLGGADTGDGDLFEDVRGSDGAVGVAGSAGLELR